MEDKEIWWYIRFCQAVSQESYKEQQFQFIIYRNYVKRMSIDLIKENGFTVKKKKVRSRRYPTETITDTDKADDHDMAYQPL